MTHRLRDAGAVLAVLGALAAVTPAADAAGRDPYVVVLAATADCAASTQTVVTTYGVRVTATYGATFCGFAAKLTAAQVDALRSDPAVTSVQADSSFGGV